MLFNSFSFFFGFLPVALAITYLLGRWRQNAAKIALCLLSLAFYGFAQPRQIPLLLGVILFNFAMGRLIFDGRAKGQSRSVQAWLTLGVLVDLGLLIWFKYAGFLAHDIGWLFGARLDLGIVQPLAISFFTFQLIGFLIDTARAEAPRIGFLDFALFVTFFPKLLSGPIVHDREFTPQIRTRRFARLQWRNILVGLVIFAIGLFKKSVIADSLGHYVDLLFPDSGARSFGLGTGWLAAATYTFQLYFDFSGYSDMAIGLGRMFGVKLPLNFHSPLRAACIIDYWRRWHMTLQRFIVAYIFAPLSLPMNRLAAEKDLRRWAAFAVGVATPTFATFVTIGVWHGAGWTYALFGAMHAFYVCVNEAWRERRKLLKRKLKRAGRTLAEPRLLQLGAYHLLTLTAVAYANVMFRAHSAGDAVAVWAGMSGLGGAGAIPPSVDYLLAILLALSAAIVFLAPNTQQIMGRFDPAQNWDEWRDVGRPLLAWTWKPSIAGLAFAGAVLFFGLMFIQNGQATFLYFKF